MTEPLDRGTIQALLFGPFPCAHSRHLLLRCADKAGARRFLAEWLPHVSHGGLDLTTAPGPFLNIAVSFAGLAGLGAFDDLGGTGQAKAAFADDFTKPIDALLISAFGASAPENWWNRRFTSEDIGFSIHVYARSAEDLDGVTQTLRASALANGLDELIPTPDGTPITGQVLEEGPTGLRKLHFGYSDGFSQPQINWDDDPALGDASPPNGKGVYPRRYFIVDEWDPKLESLPRPEPLRDLVRHGSYLALAWIKQDVAAFNRFLKDRAGEVARPGMGQAEAEEFLAAKLMGRWRDGTPLVLSPDEPDPSKATSDFDYAADEEGRLCPFASHIRITNGRDQPLDFRNRMMFPAGFPRVLRRGSSYGPPLTGTVDDGVDRGIFGMFLCAGIRQQFLPLMRWIGRTDFSDAYTDQRGQDPLFASRAVPSASGNFAIPTEGDPVVLRGLPDFIRIQGVAIMLLPSLTTLRRLASAAQ
jgi:deferrochelatase/peroxidase EfeB